MVGSRGFTVLELLVVVAVTAILLTLAVPSLRTVMLNSRRSDASTSLYGAMVNARSEAVARNAVITVCQRSTSASSFPQCALSGGSWAGGWIVFNGGTTIGSGAPTDPTTIIAVGDAVDTAFNIATAPASTSYVQFQGSGRQYSLSGASTLIWTLCKTGDAGFVGRIVTVEPNGRVSLSVPTTNCPGT